MIWIYRFLTVGLIMAGYCAGGLAARIEYTDFGDDQPYDKLSGALVTPHIAWAAPYDKGPCRILVIAPTWRQRETVELAQRMDLDYAPLMTDGYQHFGNYKPGGERGIYMVIKDEQFNQLVKQRMAVNYDLIVIGKIGWDVFPAPVQTIILDKVKEGCGLVYIGPSKLPGELESALKEDKTLSDSVVAGIPVSVLPRLKDVPIGKLIRCGRIGKGRVVALDYGEATLHPYVRLTMSESLTPYRSNDPLYYDYYFSLLAKVCLWAANKVPEVSFKNVPEIKTIEQKTLPETKLTVAVEGSGLNGAGRLQYIVRDRQNRVEVDRSQNCRAGENTIVLPLLTTGEKMLDIWIKRKDAVVNWMTIPFTVVAPLELKKITLEKQVYRKGETIKGTVALSQPAGDQVTLLVEVWDNDQRKVASVKPSLAGAEVPFEITLDHPLGSYYSVKAVLQDRKAVLSEAETSLYLNITDFSATISDFTFHVWDGYANSRSGDVVLKQFLQYGFDVLYNIVWDQTSEKGWEAASGEARAGMKPALLVALMNYKTADSGTNQTDGPEIKDCAISKSPEEQQKSRPTFIGLESVQNVVRGYAPLGPVYYDITGEAKLSESSVDVCFCKNCQASFRTYLKTVYPDLAALNSEWGTQYQQWEDVKPITLKEAYRLKRYPQWLDHRLYMESLFTKLHLRYRDVIRKEDPAARTGIHGPYYPARSSTGYNFYQLLPHFNYFCWYATDVSFCHEVKAVQSFLPKDSLKTGWFGCYSGQTTEERMRYFPWHILLLGGNAVSWWVGSDPGMGLGGPAGVSPDYLPLRHLQQAGEEVRELKSGIARMLLASRRQTHPIGVYYSTACLHAATIRPRETTWENSLFDFLTLFQDAGYECVFLSPDDIRAGKLKDYKALVLPYSQAMSPDESKAIRDFVGNGGVLMADFAPAIMDEHGKMLEKSSLTDVFGAFTPMNINSFGKGKGVCLADYVKGYYEKRKSGGGKGICSGMIQLISTLSGVAPFVKLENTDGSLRQDTEVGLFSNGRALYLGVLRVPQACAAVEKPEMKITLPAAYHVYNVRERRYLGETNVIDTALAPGRARLWALLPQPVKGIAIGVDEKKAKQGQRINVTIRLSPETLSDIGLAVRLEVYNPAGRPIPCYGRNLISRNGTCQCVIPISLNEPLGEYRIVARDVVSGLEASETFRVKSL